MGFEKPEDRAERASELAGALSEIALKARNLQELAEAINFMGANTKLTLKQAMELAERLS